MSAIEPSSAFTFIFSTEPQYCQKLNIRLPYMPFVIYRPHPLLTSDLSKNIYICDVSALWLGVVKNTSLIVKQKMARTRRDLTPGPPVVIGLVSSSNPLLHHHPKTMEGPSLSVFLQLVAGFKDSNMIICSAPKPPLNVFFSLSCFQQTIQVMLSTFTHRSDALLLSVYSHLFFF